MWGIPSDRTNQWAPGIFQPRKDAGFLWKEGTSLSSILIWMVAPVQVSWNKQKKIDQLVYMEFLLLPPDTRNTAFLCVRHLNKTLVWGSFLHLCPVIMCKSTKNASMCIKIRPESYAWCLPEPQGTLWRISSRIFNKKRERRCIPGCGSILFKTTTSQKGLFTGFAFTVRSLSGLLRLWENEGAKQKPQNWNLENSQTPSQHIIQKYFRFDEIWKALFSWKQFAVLDILLCVMW